MRIVIVGAGVVGLTTAYLLKRAGHDVVVVEAALEAGAGASYANGAQLSYSYVAPLAGPAVFADLPRILFSQASPVRFRLRFDPAQWGWASSFLVACTAARNHSVTRRLLDLAALSREELQRLLAVVPIRFAQRSTGKLVIYRSEASFLVARRAAHRLSGIAPRQDVLSAQQCVEVEPFLGPQLARIAGGIFTPSDETGDCLEFCRALARDVPVICGERIERIEIGRGRAIAAIGAKQRFEGDAFVIANGIGARRLAATAGLTLPIQPMKGYSLTIPAPANGPSVSVTDFEYRTVFAPLGERLRIAGIADLVGEDASIDPARLRVLAAAAKTFLGAEVSTDSQPWAGLRPATPTGLPILGATRVPGLFVNAGHGGLGFTLAMGSARVLTRAICIS